MISNYKIMRSGDSFHMPEIAIMKGRRMSENAFERTPDGSWIFIAPATFDGPNGRIQVAPGKTFVPGRLFMGFDLAKWREDQALKHGRPAQAGPTVHRS